MLFYSLQNQRIANKSKKRCLHNGGLLYYGVVRGTQHTTTTMNATPKTDSILNGVKQLDGITLSTAEELVRKIRTAETAMRAAQEKFAQTLRDLADDLTTDGDGWTFQEIWMTDLRGSSEIMQHLRAKGLDA